MYQNQGLVLFWLDQLQIPHGAIAKIRLLLDFLLRVSTQHSNHGEWLYSAAKRSLSAQAVAIVDALSRILMLCPGSTELLQDLQVRFRTVQVHLDVCANHCYRVPRRPFESARL